MNEHIDNIAGLIGKHLDNSLTDGEKVVLEEWINASESNRRLFTEINDPQHINANLGKFYAYDMERMTAKIDKATTPVIPAPVVHRVHFLRKWGWAAAAVLLMGGTYFLVVNKKNLRPVAVAQTSVNIAPGKAGAILTLADGSQVVLDSLRNGVVAVQSGASVALADGELVYDPTGHISHEIQYNKMTTPKGRQFQMTLPDGSRAWLNAASSIRFPTIFAQNERKVEVTGEVYFEVAKDANKPFIVNVNNKEDIEVLGTSFNVNAYDNEKTINTTLLDGSVRVSTTRTLAGVVLKPGQQARTNSAATIQVMNNADVEKIMAWKNGLFNFEGANLEEVMRQLERWYDIDVVYENGIPEIYFLGEMSRQIALADLLEILRRTEVDFRIEGRKLIVLNK